MTGIIYAGSIRRACAFIIDYVIILLINIVLVNIASSHVKPSFMFIYLMMLFFFISFVGYFSVFDSRYSRGMSVGKKLLKIQVVGVEEGTISFPKAILRSVLKLYSFFLFGYVTMLFSKRRMCVHDYIMKTGVVIKQ